MKPKELEKFLQRHDLSNDEFAQILGVTVMAVNHWLSGRRTMSLMLVRLLRLFDAKPKLMEEFQG